MVSTGASVSSAVATRCKCSGERTTLFAAAVMKVVARAASMTAPASARPNRQPEGPAAELIPAASFARSSETGASVSLLSWETRRPNPRAHDQ